MFNPDDFALYLAGKPEEKLMAMLAAKPVDELLINYRLTADAYYQFIKVELASPTVPVEQDLEADGIIMVDEGPVDIED